MLQGAPLPGDAVFVVVPWSAADGFTDWLDRQYGQRWHERWQLFGYLPLDPHLQAAHRWTTRYGEIRARLVDELPGTLEVCHGAARYRVVPLADLVLDDPATGELLDRYRRLRAGTGDGAGGGPVDRG